MARIARIVAPGYPHHVTQRGNRRQRTFFCDGDYTAYLELMAEWCGKHGVEVWAYCLMPNHVHLICVPETEDGLRLAIGKAHRRYSRRINFRENWRGHLWQGRFASYVMDERHLFAATRYIEVNPVRAGLVEAPGDYPWSSAAAHLSGKDDVLLSTTPLLAEVRDWNEFLSATPEENLAKTMRMHERTGRPLGDDKFIGKLEVLLNRFLHKKKPGRPRKEKK